jgi:amidohydrolase
LKDLILSLCDQLEPEFISMRRAFHQIPEPSFGEYKTQARIGSYLKSARIPFRTGVGGTGVVGLIRGGAGQAIALRADMDALNLNEKTGLAFSSKHQGFMHACGHDAHMAMILGAGLVLRRLGKDLPGQVKLIFQPAEETPPGGAIEMIRKGVLRSPKVRAIIGVHVDPVIAAGKVAVNAGPISAAADDFRIRILGRGGHGSSPHVAVDAIVVAAQFITSLQTIVSRRVSALDNVVVTIGKISGGEKDNIIAETVEMEGTIRTKRASLRRRVPAMMRRLLRSVCSANGATGTFEYIEGYPALVCDEAFSALVKDAAVDVLGVGRVLQSPGFEMGGEDFAYYAQEVPGTDVFVGVGNRKKGKVFRLHQAQFDIDEAALKVGVSVVAHSAYVYLSKRKRRGQGKRSR